MGDGKQGICMEAAMFANHHNLDNLIAIIDRNNLTVLDFTEKIIKLNPFKKRLSFGWNVLEADGHNINEIQKKLIILKNLGMVN